ncbi:MAG: P-II family nitrogen regulator [Tannerella sp.]|jgi:nitrogen regulatory protein PII 2|nr:P-II family nitrogen regulator [Tannerella sp.]
MKEIIAIIRPSKMNLTKKNLDALDLPSVTAIPVLGRGKQRGLNPVLSGIEISKGTMVKGHITGMKFVPKRMLIIVAKDEDVDVIVSVLVKSNKTGYIGDGKIFVCPTDDALKVRTMERGDAAL